MRLYDHLFAKADPEDVPEGQDWRANLNPKSLEVVHAKVEPSLVGAEVGTKLQLERQGYFSVDKDSAGGKLVLNRAVSLKDSSGKEVKKGAK